MNDDRTYEYVPVFRQEQLAVGGGESLNSHTSSPLNLICQISNKNAELIIFLIFEPHNRG